MSVRKSLRRRPLTAGREKRARTGRAWLPEAEALEGRTLLSIITWTNKGSGTNNTDGFYGVFGAKADTARADVQAAIDLWMYTINSFNYSDETDTFNLTINMSPTKDNGAEAAWPSKIDASGKPQAGSIVIDSGSDGKGGGYYLDPTPYDSAEFRASITNAFALDAISSSAAYGQSDLFTVALLETTHEMGISSDPNVAFQKDPNGYLKNTGVADSAYTGTLWTYTGPDVQALLTTDDGGSPEGNGLPPHTADPAAGNKITYNGSTYYGVQDSDNAYFESGRRYLVSDLDALILKDSYGYTINLPANSGNGSYLTNAYANFDPASGDLLIRGGQEGEDIYEDDSASNDVIDITTTAGGALYKLTETVRKAVPGTGPNQVYISYFPTSLVKTIEIETSPGGSSNVDVQDTASNTTTTVYSFGSDNIQVGDNSGNGQNIQGPVGLVTEPGYQVHSITINNYADTATRSVTITDSSITGLMPAAITYSGSIAEMGIGAGSSDFFAIPSTLSGCQTDIYAAGQNKYTVGDSSGLQHIRGTLDLYALGVNPLNIYLDDSPDATGRTATITASTITGLAAGNIRYEDDGPSEFLYVFGGTGSNTFNIQGVGTGSLTDLYTSGSDNVHIGDSAGTADIAGSLSIDNLSSTKKPAVVVDDAAGALGGTMTITSGSISGLSPETIYYGGALTSLTIKGPSQEESYYVNSTAAGYTTYLDANGFDSVTVGDGNGARDIQGPLDVVVGGISYVNMYVGDNPDSSPRTATLTSSSISGLSPAPIGYSGPLHDLGVGGGTGGVTYDVQGTAAGVLTSVTTAGADVVAVGSAGNLQNIKGTLVIDLTSSPSPSSVILDDSADPTGRTMSLVGNAISGLTPASIIIDGTPNHLLIEGGTGSNTFNVETTLAGFQTEIDTFGTGVVNVGGSFGVQGIVGPLYLDNRSGTARPSLVINDTPDATGRTASLSAGSITGLAPAAISYAGALSSLLVEGGTGSDTFNVAGTVAGYTTTLYTNGPGLVSVNDSTGVQDIKGPLAVSNKSSTAAPYLALSDNGDTTARNPTYADGSVTGLAPATISYSGLFGYFETYGGSGGGSYAVQGTTSGYATYIEPGGAGSFKVGNAGSVQGIKGALWIENLASRSTLTVDDSADTSARTVTLDHFTPDGTSPYGRITGLAPAVINYYETGVNSPVTIDGGTGGNRFTVAGTNVVPITLNAGSGSDTVTLQSTAASVSVNGQGGTNTLVGPNATSTWSITAAGGGSVGSVSFASVQALTGGTGNDTFKFTSGSVTGKVDGGTGTNTLDYSGDGGTAVTVSLAALTATRVGSFANIGSLVGSTSTSDKLVGANTSNIWTINASNAGSVGSFTFSSIENLTGGTGLDEFVLGAGLGISGRIDGGSAGSDWLDLGAYSTAVTVNLSSGTATGIGGGIANIRNVRGGQGGNNLTGNTSGNVLIGGSGADTIAGGSGRSILIGGKGNDTVTGGSADDIVIGGYTSYDPAGDAHDQAMDAILAEWQSANSYATRISHITSGGGLNGSNELVFGTSVLDDGGTSTLRGGSGTDWFFKGTHDTIADLASGEQVNPTAASASFIKKDTTTQGTWIGTYGSQGYDVIGTSASLPSYATVTPAGQSGWTWASSTTDTRALQVAGGASRIAAAWYATTSFTVDVDLADGQQHDLELYFLDWDKQGRSEQVQITNAATGAVLSTQTVSSFQSGIYLDYAISGNVLITITKEAGTNAVLSGLFLDSTTTPTPTPTTATFLEQDTTTQGTWIHTYGAQGYDVIGSSTSVSIPSYATVTPAGQSGWTWASSTTDTRALQVAGGASRIAAAWYATTSFTVDVDLADGQQHDLELYFLDWDKQGRSEQVQITNAATGAVLSIQTVSSFQSGIYLDYAISGNVLITITKEAGTNAVLSGLFLGSMLTPTPTSTATFLKQDTTTQGTWIGTYGAQGYDIVGGPTGLPSGDTVAHGGQSHDIYTTTSTDPRELQVPGSSNRVAAVWYSSTSFTVAVNLGDGQSHDLELYFLDWDKLGRSEQVQISNSAGTVLDTESVSSFTNGVYLDWKASGAVVITITNKGPQNAVLDGLFLDAPSTTNAMSEAGAGVGRLDGSLSSTIVTQPSGLAAIVAETGDDNKIPSTLSEGAPRAAAGSIGGGAIGLTGDYVDRVLGDLADGSPAQTQPASSLVHDMGLAPTSTWPIRQAVVSSTGGGKGDAGRSAKV